MPRLRLSARPAGRAVRLRATLRLEELEARRLLSGGTAAYGQLPLAFEPNVGQAAAGTDFLAHGPGYALALAPSGAALSLHQPTASGTLALRLIGANPQARVVGLDSLPGVSNYLIGNNPSTWHTNIPNYSRVDYATVYPGIDLDYYGHEAQLEYDFVVRPGSYPDAIRLQMQGVQALSVDANGDLLVRTSEGTVLQQAPSVYQEIDGLRQFVRGRYILQDGGAVGFGVGAYDPMQPLVIDPVLSYSTYLGGVNGDSGYGIAVDGGGNAYVTGTTLSGDFPTVAPFQGGHAGSFDAFVGKFNPSGSALVYSTYLGGSGDDYGYGIAVDTAGNDYVTGSTNSSDFPTVAPLQATYGLNGDAFVAKLNATGDALVYSTYLGGSGADYGYGIAVDASGSAYATGSTYSGNFPTASALQVTSAGSDDAFVAKLNPSGSALVYSTYLGGTGDDVGKSIAVDASGSAYVIGYTLSTNFPTANALQPHSKGTNAFVTHLDPAGGSLVYSTYLGGSGGAGGGDQGYGIAVDASGSAYITGYTGSSNFPVVAPLQAFEGYTDAFVCKLNPTGSAIVYSTFLGGSYYDYGRSIAVDALGNAYVTGYTLSSDFPTVAPLQRANAGASDAFVAKLNAAGSALVYSTYLGGITDDFGYGVAVDAAGDAYVTGYTGSTNFPTAASFQPAPAGGGDTFVAKIIGHLWQGRDVAVGSDNESRLLWSTADGRADVWAIAGASSPIAGPTFGPLSGWSVKAFGGGGSDGLVHVLWTNNSGTAALWLLNANGTLTSIAVFSLPAWTAQDLAVDSSGRTHLLWTNSNGKVVVWTVSNSFTVTSGPLYGPFSGWTAERLDAGSDGLLRLLWTDSNGAAAVWVLNASNVKQAVATYAAVAGWIAEDIAVGSDGFARILWTDPGASAAAVYELNASLTISAATVYGGSSLAGWQAQTLSGGADGLLRVEWNNSDGTASVWLVSNDGSFNSAGVFGPF